MKRALIVRNEWLDLILSGEKTWEMRSRMTNVRGKIGLIESGSGKIVGECHIDDCIDMSNLRAGVLYRLHLDKHCVNDTTALNHWNKAWVVSSAKRYKNPIPYKHPRGAVIWVDLEKALKEQGAVLVRD